jgi:molecular chaperone GrpE
MTQQEDHTPDGVEPSAVGAEGSEGVTNAPGPQADQQESELTVDDILSSAQSEAAAEAEAAEAPVDPLDDAANPYLEDLRRITAEYANYRKRTTENAEIEKQRAKAAAVNPLLSVLDDLDRAEAHGDLEEGSAFATIAQKLRGSFERMGLVGFGEKGEVFDPQVHEAIAQLPMPGTEQPTVLDVVERGYRLGEVELRPAKVAVAVPADG